MQLILGGPERWKEKENEIFSTNSQNLAARQIRISENLSTMQLQNQLSKVNNLRQ